MKKTAWLIVVSIFLLGGAAKASGRGSSVPVLNSGVEEIQSLFKVPLKDNEAAFMFLGYSGVIVRTAKGAVVIDPDELLTANQIKEFPAEGVSFLLFTHGHGDHYVKKNAADLQKATNAMILAEESVAGELQAAVPKGKISAAISGKSYESGGVQVRVINGVHVGPIRLFWIKIGELTFFHAGDSGYVPLKGYEARIVFLPAGKPSPTASPEDAFKMAQDLKPGVVIAMHGSTEQYQRLEQKIRAGMPDAKVIVPKLMVLQIVER